jgi:alginate O-acetyltransferase complex protein AlgJ
MRDDRYAPEMPQADRPDARDAGAEPITPGDLLPQHVESTFLEFLGRPASPEDVAVWMGVGSLRALIDGVLASEEYTSRVARRAASEGGPFLNCWTPGLERFSRPVGSVSPDGVTIVGARGHLFLYGGSNNNLAMYRGEIAMAPDWLAQWRALVSERLEHARARGRPICFLVVPDKLAVYADLFPQDLDSGGTRPVVRLIEDACLPLLYPCDVLRDARTEADTYMLTDSHLSERGNRLLAETTIRALGASTALLDGVSPDQEPLLTSGDLGQHFTPPIVELRQRLLASSSSTIAFDNWPEVSSVGGHIGTLRIFRYDDAPDRRTVVVFGDSYGFGDEAYRGLSWFLAQAFREVHFVWVPFGWDPEYLDRVGAELVVCQTAERFIARVPRPRVDVQLLARESLGRGGALGLERIFGDVAAS